MLHRNNNSEAHLGSTLEDYDHGDFFCELTSRIGPESPVSRLVDELNRLEPSELRSRAEAAERELHRLGITFTVYTERDVIDRILPFDIVPRIIDRHDWARLEAGVSQRVEAINAFLHDIYHGQKIIADGIIPGELIRENSNFRPEMVDFSPPCGTYVHINGTDLVRDADGSFLVLEDNARTPSGVSYVVENRRLMLRAFPDLFAQSRVRPVENYGQRLHDCLAELAPESVLDPQVVILTPGVFNSAYFEHLFLAREMGVPLVEGQDLFVGEDDRVYYRTVQGPQEVNVIYRRIDDDFLDPDVFNPESVLGVAGLMRAYAKGTVVIANAPGTGVADDKALYAYMPRIIKYYLDAEPILDNVPTYLCREDNDLNYVLEHLEELVTKPVGGSGGYGVVIGPSATQTEIASQREKIQRDPNQWIAQPLVRLSVSPTLTGSGLEPRHVDLRPFAVTGKSTWVLPGGLTRVALPRGSVIVNSSQGGGSKDTWVLE